jgi:DNA-binding winged helix-turn-helix (wHTH) protein
MTTPEAKTKERTTVYLPASLKLEIAHEAADAGQTLSIWVEGRSRATSKRRGRSNVACRELRRSGEPIALEPQVFDGLVHLIRNRDRVVNKDDLLESVWKGRIVSESTLTSRINAARKAVGDSGEAQRLIRTVPRKGFRFVGDVADEQPTEPRLPHIPRDRPSIAVLPFENLSGDRDQGLLR